MLWGGQSHCACVETTLSTTTATMRHFCHPMVDLINIKIPNTPVMINDGTVPHKCLDTLQTQGKQDAGNQSYHAMFLLMDCFHTLMAYFHAVHH
jgi:hypothetical protein